MLHERNVSIALRDLITKYKLASKTSCADYLAEKTYQYFQTLDGKTFFQAARDTKKVNFQTGCWLNCLIFKENLPNFND